MSATSRLRPLLASLLGAMACSRESAGPLPPCTAAGFAVPSALGAYIAFDPTAGSAGCAVFAANASTTDSAEYLVVPQLATGVPGRTSTFWLRGDTIRPSLNASAARRDPPDERSPAERFHEFLRLSEAGAIAVMAPEPAGARGPAHLVAAGPPPVGSMRTFRVCATLTCTQFDTVGAVVRALRTRVAIYVDTLAPAGGLTANDLDSIATVFDTQLYPADTAAFGRESDIDTNTVVLVLMTNTVNRLVSSAQCASSGYVAGFFYGSVDLHPAYQSDSRSNKGEIFYSIVADPAGILPSCPHSRDQVKRVIPVTFIHEFQHMISFNQHVLVRGRSAEVLWLNEGLSHLAEELGGRAFGVGTPAFSQFTMGNVRNAYDFLEATEDHFLLPATGVGTLGERGAAWLFVRYVVDRYATDTTVSEGNKVTRALVETPLTGAQNVANRAGDPFDVVVTRWALANWVSDLPGFTAPPELRYRSWQLRTTYDSLHALNPAAFPLPFPLVPSDTAGAATDLSGTLRAGAGVYHRALQAPGGAGFTLLFSAGNGSALSAGLAPRLNIIRVR